MKRSIGIFLLLLLISPPGWAAEPDKTVSGKVVLSGKVLDQTTGKGVPGVDVVAGGVSPPLSASTAEDGSFSFENVAAGEYRLFAYAPGFEPSETVLVRVRAGEKVTGVQLKILSKAAAEEARKSLAAISGRVLAGAQAPPERVAVFLMDSERKVVDGGNTEPDGSFQFKAKPGAYVVSVDPTALEGFDLKEPERSVPALKSGQAAAGIEFVFEPVARVYGTVRDADGKPVAWAEVSVRSEKVDEPIIDVTDASGAYALEGLSAGEWQLRARAEDEEIFYELLKIDPVKEKELEISISKPIWRDEIVGEVRSVAGKPLAGVKVFATREPPSTETYGPLETDSAGRFHFKGLPGWTFTVTAVGKFGEATKEKVPAGSPELTGVVALVLPATEEEALSQNPDFQRVSAAVKKMEETSKDPEALRRLAPPLEKALPPGAVVEGVVLTQGGAPAPGVVVVLLDSKKNPIPDLLAETDAKGHFSIRPVDDGSYYILAGRTAQEKTEPVPVAVSKGRVEKPIELRMP